MLQNITVNENSCSSFANSVSDENTTSFLAFKMWIGTSEFDHRILLLL